MEWLFGKLTLAALPHEWFTIGGALFCECHDFWGRLFNVAGKEVEVALERVADLD